MDVLEMGPDEASRVRRCHLWCWAPSSLPLEWEKRTVLVGGLSFVGLAAAAVSSTLSRNGNRKRRQAALREAAPRWRYVASGNGHLVDGVLTVNGASGIVHTFDLGTAVSLDGPALGWIRVQPARVCCPVGDPGHVALTQSPSMSGNGSTAAPPPGCISRCRCGVVVRASPVLPNSATG